MSPHLHRRTALAKFASAAIGAWALSRIPGVAAQETTALAWPVRPVRVVVSSGAGGQTDLFARYTAENLAKAFGQPFIVDNKPGASGDIAAMAVVKAPPDGHTLLFAGASFTVVPAAVNTRHAYDLLRDLAPIVQIGVGGMFLAVAGDSQVRSLQDLIELVRREPDKHGYGTAGIASTAHMAMASLLARQGLNMPHVPYKSSAEVLRDLSGGVLQVGWIDSSSSISLVQSGKVRPLAVGATMRMPATPQVPTLSELGHSMELNGWLGLFAPVRTPAAVIRAVNAEVNRVMHSDEGERRLAAMNLANPPAITPEQFAERLRSDIQGWRRLALETGIKPES